MKKNQKKDQGMFIQHDRKVVLIHIRYIHTIRGFFSWCVIHIVHNIRYGIHIPCGNVGTRDYMFDEPLSYQEYQIKHNNSINLANPVNPSDPENSSRFYWKNRYKVKFSRRFQDHEYETLIL